MGKQNGYKLQAKPNLNHIHSALTDLPLVKSLLGLGLPMIKTNAPIMQTLYQPDEVLVDEQRRAFLAQKGKILYTKYCGTQGHGICSESFAEYHIWRGEYIVARDFLIYLESELITLREKALTDSQAAFQLTITQRLVDHIQSLLGETESLVAI